MNKFTVTLGPAALTLLLGIFSGTARAAACDVDADGDVDRNDINAIFAARNTPASGPDDPRDANGDGVINVLDGRLCARQCTLPACAVVAANPQANDDSYDALGNVAIIVDMANGVLSNDINAPSVVGPLNVTAFDNPSANGGDVSINTNGSFSYDPPAGFEGTDTFTYTIEDVNSNTDTATVSVAVSNMVWFIDNTASGGGDGRLSQPFNSVAAFGAAADDPGDTIFLYEGTGSVVGSFNLKDNQSLIGEGVGLGSITPPPFSAPLPGAGNRPSLNNGDPAVNLAQNNTVAGFDIDAVRGIVGNTVGTFTANSMAISCFSGRALDLQNGLLDVSLDSVSSSGSGVGGIVMNSVGGNFSVSGTTNVDHSTIGSGITVADSFFGIGDSANFGDTTVSGPGGILLMSNGGTASFTFNSLDVTAFNGDGLRVIDSGILNITGTSNNVFASNGGAAVEIVNTTIGAPITFESVSASNTFSGIVLTNTGSSGFTVIGDPGTTQNTSGGSISSVTNDGIALTNTGNIELNQMAVSQTGGHGLFGNGVVNLTINDSTFSNTGNQDNEDALSFRSGGAALTGTVTLNNVDISDFHDTGLYVSNTSGSVGIQVVNGSDFDDNDDVNGTHGIFVQTGGTADATLVVNGSVFNDIEGDIVRFEGGSPGTNDVDIIDTVSTNGGGPDNFPNGGGINLLVTGNASITFDIDNNDLRDMRGDIINLVGTAGGGSMQGRIQNNTLSGGAGTFGDGIRIDNGSFNPPGVEVWTILVDSNDIGVDSSFPGMGDDGIQVLFTDTDGILNLTVENNTIGNTASEGARMFFDEDTGAGGGNPLANVRIANNVFTNIATPESLYLYNRDTSQACYHIIGNSLPFGSEIRLRERDAAFVEITQLSAAALSVDNGGAIINVSDNPISFNGSCTNPPLPAN